MASHHKKEMPFKKKMLIKQNLHQYFEDDDDVLAIPITCRSWFHLIIARYILDARSCVTCDTVLAELEKIDDDTDSFGVDFVKINDKRLAKQYGIKNFPALTYFR